MYDASFNQRAQSPCECYFDEVWTSKTLDAAVKQARLPATIVLYNIVQGRFSARLSSVASFTSFVDNSKAS